MHVGLPEGTYHFFFLTEFMHCLCGRSMYTQDGSYDWPIAGKLGCGLSAIFKYIKLEYVFFPQTVWPMWPHWGVLKVTVGARCSAFSLNKFIQNRSCEMSMCVSTAQALANRCPSDWRPTFFLHISMQTGSCEMSMCVSTAQALANRCPSDWRPAFFLHISMQTGSCEMSMCVSTAQARTSSFQDTSSRDLWRGSPYRDLVQRSCQEISFTDLVQRPGEQSIDLPQRSCVEVLSRKLTCRSLIEILCGDLFKTPCTDSLTQGSCTAASLESLNIEIFPEKTRLLPAASIPLDILFYLSLIKLFGVSCRDNFQFYSVLQFTTVQTYAIAIASFEAYPHYLITAGGWFVSNEQCSKPLLVDDEFGDSTTQYIGD